MSEDTPIKVLCESCSKRVDPVLVPGEDFTQVNCPTCGKDLTLLWYTAQQFKGPLRWVKWFVPLAILAMLAIGSIRSF